MAVELAGIKLVAVKLATAELAGIELAAVRLDTVERAAVERRRTRTQAVSCKNCAPFCQNKPRAFFPVEWAWLRSRGPQE